MSFLTGGSKKKSAPAAPAPVTPAPERDGGVAQTSAAKALLSDVRDETLADDVRKRAQLGPAARALGV